MSGRKMHSYAQLVLKVTLIGQNGTDWPSSRTDFISERLQYPDRLMRYLIEEVDESLLFREPVDPVKWKIPDYFDIVKYPMDFGSIRIKLNVGIDYRCISVRLSEIDMSKISLGFYEGFEPSV